MLGMMSGRSNALFKFPYRPHPIKIPANTNERLVRKYFQQNNPRLTKKIPPTNPRGMAVSRLYSRGSKRQTISGMRADWADNFCLKYTAKRKNGVVERINVASGSAA